MDAHDKLIATDPEPVPVPAATSSKGRGKGKNLWDAEDLTFPIVKWDPILFATSSKKNAKQANRHKKGDVSSQPVLVPFKPIYTAILDYIRLPNLFSTCS